MLSMKYENKLDSCNKCGQLMIASQCYKSWPKIQQERTVFSHQYTTFLGLPDSATPWCSWLFFCNLISVLQISSSHGSYGSDGITRKSVSTALLAYDIAYVLYCVLCCFGVQAVCEPNCEILEHISATLQHLTINCHKPSFL